MNTAVGRACPQRAERDVFQTRRAARRDGLALPCSLRTALRMLILCGLMLAFCGRARAAELQLDFSRYAVNETPGEFRGILSGQGQPGDWKVILDETASPSAGAADPGAKRKVLAQLSSDPTDERFPILLYDRESFGDFKLTTRFKIVGGKLEQMAGVAFRLRDEKNYYYLRASSLGNSFRFFKVVDGQRSAPIGPELEIPRGVWHELAVECKGNQIRCSLNGKDVIPMLTDNSFSAGRIGFWTKSDSISYFADTKIVYTPRETPRHALIREMMDRYPRLLGLKIFAAPRGTSALSVIASNDPKEIGSPADKVAADVIARDSIYYGKGQQTVSVTLPLHDRNGEAMAAVKVTMKSFLGQTEQNAVARAQPIIKQMEARVRTTEELLE
ncbi:MAG: DUF1080 domain-containing protein [Verrucomicrobia bacterium]|nr:DUF1080 domain-containing protein [Verrucomicrobiota bacterium]